MPRGGRGRGIGYFGMGAWPWFGWGRGSWGWPGNPYSFCRWFPWLPRWWWSGIYGPIGPQFTAPTMYGYPRYGAPYGYPYQTGQLPQAVSWFQQQAPAPALPSAWPTQQAVPAFTGAPPAQMSRDQEIQTLEAQAAALDDQLKQIRARIDQLRGQE